MIQLKCNTLFCFLNNFLTSLTVHEAMCVSAFIFLTTFFDYSNDPLKQKNI